MGQTLELVCARYPFMATPMCKTNLSKYRHTYSCVQTCTNVYGRVRAMIWAIFDRTDMKISLYT